MFLVEFQRAGMVERLPVYVPHAHQPFGRCNDDEAGPGRGPARQARWAYAPNARRCSPQMIAPVTLDLTGQRGAFPRRKSEQVMLPGPK
jgi:hypothetical protein